MKNILVLLVFFFAVINPSFSQGANADLVDSLVSKKLISGDILKYTYSKSLKLSDHDMFYVLSMLKRRSEKLMKKPLSELTQVFTELRMMNDEFLEVLTKVHGDSDLEARAKFKMLQCVSLYSLMKEEKTKSNLPKNLKRLGYNGMGFEEKIESFKKGNCSVSELMISSQIFHEIPNRKIHFSQEIVEYVQLLFNELFEKDEIKVLVSEDSKNLLISSSGITYSINKNELQNIYSEEYESEGKSDSIDLVELNYYSLLELAQQFAADNEKYAAIKMYDFHSLLYFMQLDDIYQEYIELFPHLDFIKSRYAILKLNDRDYSNCNFFPVAHPITDMEFGLSCQANIEDPKSSDIAYMSTMVRSAEKVKFVEFLKENKTYLGMDDKRIDEILYEIMNTRIYERSNMFKYANVKKLTVEIDYYPVQVPSKGSTIKSQFYSVYDFFGGEFEVSKMDYNKESKLISFKYNKKEYSVKNNKTEILKLGAKLLQENKKEKRILYTINEFGRITSRDYYFMDKRLKTNLEELLRLRFVEVKN